ncbi:O-antigen ligase family protein [Planococcus sp. N064]|uniref:O-antigen ligase family protein n=1 Tax=Planococcus liqunii TaxID=3058394 RepID=A0ABT8MNG1_9BACL|nr:O-antigen ligase family protein [Planococcus sp. N064]MDN7226432.1 O-antigen ligase family protein [Planococcus sp. N064]
MLFKRSEFKKILIYLSISIFNILFLFHAYLGSILIILFGIIFFLWFLFIHRKKWNFVQSLSFLLSVYIPTSFVSILGTSYGTLPITWFNITVLIIFILIIFSKIRLNFFMFGLFLIFIFGLLSLTQSIDQLDALKQLLTIILFIISILIGEFLIKYSVKEYNEKLKEYYLLSVFVFALMVVLQKIMMDIGIAVGYYSFLGSNREVYAGLFNDYSFATLYVATGSIILLIDYIDKKRISTFFFIFGEAVLLLTMLVINSRTGLVSLLLTAILFLLYKIIKGKLKAIFFLPLFLISIPILVAKTIENRGGQSFVEGSGRIELLFQAFEVFTQAPFLGVGFGLNNLYLKTGMHVPHNLFAQYLVQFGLIGFSIFFSILIIFFVKYFKYKSDYLWVILTVFIGAMLIPDIVSSRFLSVLIILTIITSTNKIKIEEGSIK